MSALRHWQQAFLAAVLGGSDSHGAEGPGLRVYANNYRGQLLGSLRETYEQTVTWLGRDAFDQYAGAYLEVNRSAGWSLNDYGQAFPAWLADALPPTNPAAELAWIDNALRNAFYGAHATPLKLMDAAVRDWEAVTFAFVPTLRFQPMRTNAAAIWPALAAGRVAPQPCVLAAPVAVRTWRQELTPRFTSMPAAEAACLDLAMAGGTFGEMCILLAAHHPQDELATHAGTLLRAWFDDGLVAAVGEP